MGTRIRTGVGATGEKPRLPDSVSMGCPEAAVGLDGRILPPGNLDRKNSHQRTYMGGNLQSQDKSFLLSY